MFHEGRFLLNVPSWLEAELGSQEYLINSPVSQILHDDVIKWKHFPRYWPFVWGIHRSPVNSTHKGQWRGALMFSLICAWINAWVNNREAGDFRRHRAHYYVIVMQCTSSISDNTQFRTEICTCNFPNTCVYIFHEERFPVIVPSRLAAELSTLECLINWPVSQIPQCTSPISHNTPFIYVHISDLNGAIRDMELVHEIWELG